MEPISLSQGRFGGPLLRLQSDERLARLAASGGEGAFDVLVRRHRAGLLRGCRRILPDTRAEDAVQQCLLSAHQALRRNGPPERFEPWLHRIAVNAALKELQRSPQELPLAEEAIDGVEQPDERLERRERMRGTIGAIAALPDRQRRALVMRELEGRSHTEIARDLGLTNGAVRQLIHRARGSVRTAVSALTPYGLLLRAAGTETHSQTAELVAGSVAGSLAGKAAVTALVAGGIAGGVAMAPDDGKREAEASGARPPKGVSPALVGSSAADGPGDDRGRDRGDEGDNSGPGGGENRGRGHSEDEPPAEDSSGPGGGGSGSSGPGGGSESSGPGGGSGSSGSGSGSSGSGSSGSGSSGSGSGSSGSSDDPEDP